MKSWKEILKLTLRVALGALLLAWIFHSIFLNEASQQHTPADWAKFSRTEQWHEAWSVGPRELWHTLLFIHPAAFGFSLVLMCLTIFLGVFRWQMVLKVQGLDLSLRRAAGISFVAHFFNSFLLGSTGGDLMKAYYAARETHHLKTEAVTTVFVDRLIGLWAMLLFGGVMMIPNYALLARHPALGGFALLVLAMLAGCTIVLGIAFWGGVSKRFPKARVYLRKMPKGDVLERSLDSCRQFGKQKGFLGRTIGISVALNIVWVLQIMVLGTGMGLQISPLALFVIVPIVFCISALPITPSGLGVRENLFVLMLAIPEIGVPKTSALSLSLLAYAGSLFWSLVGGVVYLGLKEKEHLSEVTQPETTAENV